MNLGHGMNYGINQNTNNSLTDVKCRSLDINTWIFVKRHSQKFVLTKTQTTA
jgi:hypothetical protein